MQNARVVVIDVSGPIAVVSIGVQDRSAVEPVRLPELLDGNGNVVEAAVPAEEVPARVVTSSPDEGERVGKVPEPDPLRCLDHPPDRVACGRSERVLRHFTDEIGCVDVQNQLIRHRLGLEEGHVGTGE